ncbi:MAG: response regulator [Betaproteobacteria bacterium]|nr:response regulator [Betaproteobacteria bacterium]
MDTELERPMILIVEDDEKSRRLMRDVLEHQGYDVMETNQGEIGLELMRKLQPSLVLMDIHLPGISGLEAIREIRGDSTLAATPVVAVTASVMGNARDKIRDAGFDGFEPKPLNLKEFLGTVRRLAPV